jgi:hypothetical protein
MTLMRTHSAPPDEHAGIFELGGNGVRANTIPQSLSERTIPQVIRGFVESHLFQASEALLDSAYGSETPSTLGNGSQMSSVAEEKLFDERPELPQTDQLRSPVSQPIPYYPVEVQRYPAQLHQLPLNFSPRMMGQPRPSQESGERSKIAPVMSMQLPPRMGPSQLMPQYHHSYMTPQMQMMSNQAALGSIPLQSSVFPHMMYPIFPKYVILSSPC